VKRPGPKVAVLYNAPALPPEHPDAASEADVVAVARAIAEELGARGFAAAPVPAAPPVGRFVAALEALQPDAVFNLIEGFGGQSGGEAYITALLELLALPYTGCPPEAQALCRQKGRTKALLLGWGLPTAPFAVLEPGDDLPAVGWPGRSEAHHPSPGGGPRCTRATLQEVVGPVVVKPESEDGSLGIDQGSVVADPESLRRRIEQVRGRYGPRVVVEAYLPGPEYNVGVLDLGGPEALPVAEIAFDPAPGDWPILTYDAKWSAGSAEDRASPARCPAAIPAGLADRLGSLAVAAFRATGCRDVARVDFRLDPRGEPMILEVNPNPDLGPTAGWARALRAAGRDYGEALAALASQAIRRG